MGGEPGRQRTTFWVLTVICGASRFLAKARSAWDWDETLFLLALGDYDVASHHPHPPGFPVFVGAARAVRAVFNAGDFESYQALSLLAGVLVFPAVFMLARELRLPFATSCVAGALLAFFPNVWFFGGTAFSDVPSIVLVTFSAALYFRSARDGEDRFTSGGRGAYFLATLLLALAVGIRPQNLLVGLAPGMLATFRRGWREGVLAMLLGAAIVGAAFGGAIHATGGYERYAPAVEHHADYIARIDSYRNPDRPALWRLLDRFFLKQYQSIPLSAVTSFFVIVSIAGAIRRRDERMLWNALTFAPFAVVAWLMLDRFSINRFSIGYAPMFAVFAADGIRRVSRAHPKIEGAIGAALAGAFAVWAGAALGPVRNEVSPPVRAVEHVRGLAPSTQVYAGYSMTPFLEYFAPDLRFVRVLDDRGLPVGDAGAGAVLVAEQTEKAPAPVVFSRPRGRLWKIARRHYFEVTIRPLDDGIRFAGDWQAPERSGTDESRWLGARGTMSLPARSGDTVLRLLFNVPSELIAQNPHVDVTLNGRLLERIDVRSEETSRDFEVVPAPAGARNEVTLSIDRTLEADGNVRGLRLRYVSWGPR